MFLFEAQAALDMGILEGRNSTGMEDLCYAQVLKKYGAKQQQLGNCLKRFRGRKRLPDVSFRQSSGQVEKV